MLVSGIAVAVLALARQASAGHVEGRGYYNMDSKILTYAAFSDAAYCPYNFDAATPNQLCDYGRSNCSFLAHAETVHEFSMQSYVAGNVAISHSLHSIVVSFRGTATLWDFFTDIQYLQVPARDLCRKCLVHGGFLQAFDNVKDELLEVVMALRARHPRFGVVVTGHSLGGAVATLAATHLRNKGVFCDLFSYGSPRVGDARFANYVSRQTMGATARVTSRLDPVTVVPASMLNFQHIYPEYWFSKGFSKGRYTRCAGPEAARCSGRIPSALLYLRKRIPMHLDYWARSNPCPAYRARQIAELQPDQRKPSGQMLAAVANNMTSVGQGRA